MKLTFYISLGGLVTLSGFMKNLFFSWGLLEVYSLIFLLMVFSEKNYLKKKSSLIYFGLMSLFSSLVLVFSLLKDFYLLGFLSLLSKIGSIPMLEWVINFMKKMSWESSWFFFSLKKVIPLFMISEFFCLNFFLVLMYFFLNLLFSFKKAFLASNFFSLLGWSAVGSTSFFLLLVNLNNKFFSWVGLLFVYSFNLYFLFKNSKDKTKLFFLLVVLFGVPPVSIFLFKVGLMMFFLKYFSIFWYWFFLFSFFVFGYSYFFFYMRESQEFFKKVKKIKIFHNFWFFIYGLMFFLVIFSFGG